MYKYLTIIRLPADGKVKIHEYQTNYKEKRYYCVPC